MRLDHLLSKEHLARGPVDLVPRAMPWVFAPRMVAHGWNIDQSDRPCGRPSKYSCSQQERTPIEWDALGTLLSPEGAALEPYLVGTSPRRTAPLHVARAMIKGRPHPYLENCTVDAKQASLWPS